MSRAPLTVLTWVLVAVAELKLAVALAGFLFGALGGHPFVPTVQPAAVYLLVMLADGAAGVLLFHGGRERRAGALGVFFLLNATAFTRLLSSPLLDVPVLGALAGVTRSLSVDAFFPLYLWLFVSEFPEAPTSPRMRRFFRAAIGASAALGGLLSVSKSGYLLAHHAGAAEAPWTRVLQTFASAENSSLYYPFLFGLVLAACFAQLAQGRRARAEDRRRVNLLVFAIAVPFIPFAGHILLMTASPAYLAWVQQPDGAFATGMVVYPLLVSMPVIATYTVLVEQVLDVRLIVRKALGYALARTTVTAVTAVPFLWLIGYVYWFRGQTVEALFAGGRPVILAAITIVGGVALVFRKAVLEGVDRRFFRERVDARSILIELVDRSRAAGSVPELAALLGREIDRALHLESIAILVADAATGLLRSHGETVRPLDPGTPLGTVLGGSTQPLEVDLEHAGPMVARLPDDDRQWLADAAAHLLVPMSATDGSLLGVLVIGSKRSELPFDGEDRFLLSTIAASGALALENRLLRSSGDTRVTAAAERSPREELALECPKCGMLYAPVGGADARTRNCETCGVALGRSAVPYVLGTKFRFVRRIGTGGMGIVYLATDLALGRTVAVKTLPRVSPEASMRLRREARAAASVSHPNLALIFGAETWRGLPMLIFEYLEGGTLADRIQKAPLPPREVIRLGVTIASALERAHEAGVLHRDIKPSNVGFTRDGTPKLLDFGLARILDDSRRERGAGSSPSGIRSGATTETGLLLGSTTRTDFVVGTPAYLCPEAVRGESPEPGFDLWSLAILMYEALSGKNPMLRGTPAQMLETVREGRVPDPATAIPACPEPLAAFLRDALAQERTRRPATAHEFRALLSRIALGR